MNLDAIELGPMVLGDKPVEVEFVGDTELTITWTRVDGDRYTTTLGWDTPKRREENWRNAVKLWADRNLGEYLQQVGQEQRTRLLGHGWYFAVLSGPPTWWLPRVKAARWRLMVGWLRRGYVLSRVGH